jgi:maltose 6'-phosphate phosphatase
MKLLTLNCHSWQEENQLEKIQCLAETIKEKSYDVIALQEVSQHIDSLLCANGLKEDNFLLVLLNELKRIGVTGFEYVWDLSHIGFEVYEEGLTILSKYPILEKESFIVTKNEDINVWKTRRIVGATIEVKGKPFTFYSCHLGWWHDEEEPFTEQFDQLLSYANKHDHFFLMGDFNNNAYVRNEGYDYLKGKGLVDTFDLALDKDSGDTVKGKIKGWDENKEDLRIDLILTNKQVNVKSSKVIFNGENKPVISDHFGVEIEVDLF